MANTRFYSKNKRCERYSPLQEVNLLEDDHLLYLITRLEEFFASCDKFRPEYLPKEVIMQGVFGLF